MPRIHMTDLAVKNLKAPPAPQQVNYFDDPAHSGVSGLYLHVSFGGTKTWRVMWYGEGKSRTHKLGRYPILKLADAREEARKFLLNPQKVIAEKDPASRPATFAIVVEAFKREHIRGEKLRTARIIEQRIDKHLLPAFKNLEFASIRRPQLATLLDGVAKDNGPSMADAIMGIFRSIANWYGDKRDEDYRSPVSRKMKRHKKRMRNRVLDDSEVRALWSAAGELGTFGSILRILLLTGQRRAKVTLMEWAHIKEGVWHIHTEPGEKPNPGRIKLPKSALDILDAQPRLENTPYVFPGLRGRGAFNAFGPHNVLLDQMMRRALPDMKPHTLHDLRRTFRTRLSRIGIEPHVAERCLGHTVGSENERTYDHHDFHPEMSAAFEAFANHVAAIVTPPPANVARLADHRQSTPRRRRPSQATV